MNAGMVLPAMCAIIDIGAHSVRLEIFQIHADGSLESFEHLVRPVNLGLDVVQTGDISRENINLLCAVCADFAGRIAEYRIVHVRVAATSSLREAFNRELVTDRIRCVSGLEVEVLEAQEEARLIYLGVRDLLIREKCFPERRALCFIIGTGSLFVLYLDGGKLQFCEPIPLGSMHLFDEYGSWSVDPKRIAKLLETFCVEQRLSDSTNFDPEKPMSIIGIGSGVRALVEMRAKTRKQDAQVIRLAASDVDGLITRAQHTSREMLVRDFHMSDVEAENVGPTAEIVGYFLHEMNCREALFPAVTTRSVLAAEMVRQGREEEDPFLGDQMTAVGNIARKYGQDNDHTREVTRMALKIFDKLKKRYCLTARHRILLEIAARLHDIGRFLDIRQHHKHSMYLIENAQIPGVSSLERTLIAMIARYHRKAAPKSSHLDYMALAPEGKVTVLKLAAILRAADALENGGSSAERVKLSLSGDDLVFRLRAPADLEWEMLCLTRKGDLLRAVYGLEFKVEEALS